MYSPPIIPRKIKYCKICNTIDINNSCEFIRYSCSDVFHKNCIKKNNMSLLNPKCPKCDQGKLIINTFEIYDNDNDDDDPDYSIPPINIITVILSCMSFFLFSLFATPNSCPTKN